MSSVIKTPWEKVVTVLPSEDFSVKIVLENGIQKTIDLEKLITERESFWRLRRIRYFLQVGIDPLGGLCWPEGEDISPESLLHY